ncbi:MAG: hypothetical protein ACKO5K_00695, partial [Armatimonadota bacterium]
ALSLYTTQMEVMPRLLTSFLRRNEIFVDARDCVASEGRPCAFADPLADDLSRFANPSADIASVTVARTRDGLVATARLRANAAPGVRYVFRFRPMRPAAATTPVATRVRRVAVAESTGRNVECRIGLVDLGLPEPAWSGRVQVDVETVLPAGIVIDRTGYRAVTIAGADR